MNNSKNITAYHGSNIKFSEFDKKHIGTGEGAAKYGYGFYFTTDETVSKTYSNNGLDSAHTYKVSLWKNKKPNLFKWDDPINSNELLNIIYLYYGEEKVSDIEDEARYELDSSYSDDYFDTNFARALISSHSTEAWENLEEMCPDYDWSELKSMDDFQFDLEYDSNSSVYNLLSSIFESADKASMFLKSCGYDGILYTGIELGKDTPCYVVFDSEDIDILEIDSNTVISNNYEPEL